MNVRLLFSTLGKCSLALAVLGLLAAPSSGAQGGKDTEGPEQEEGSVAQAQATMASLFGSKTALPVPPQVEGTIALPSFDSKDLRVHEKKTQEDTSQEN